MSKSNIDHRFGAFGAAHRFAQLAALYLAFSAAACSASDSEHSARSNQTLTSTPPLSSFVLLARQAITLSDRNLVIGGNIGVSAGSGATQNALTAGADGHLAIGFDTIAQRLTFGDRTVAGNIDTSNFIPGNNGTIGGQSPFIAPPPRPVPSSATAGDQNVNVLPATSRSLSPGRYGLIKDEGTLTLEGGLYEFQSLLVASGARLIAQQPSVVRVVTTLSAKDRSALFTAEGLRARDLRLETNSSTKPTTFGNDVTVRALVLASGDVQVGDRFKMKGAIAAQSIELGHESTVEFDTGFGCTTDSDCNDGTRCSGSCVDAECQRPLACSAVQIGPGNDHACAAMADGTASCWGDNAQGDLGGGGFTDRNHPAPVLDATGVLLNGVKAVDAGGTSSCALMTDGTATCWGGIANGSSLAQPIAGVNGAVAISVGSSMACALLAGGDAACWGSLAPATRVGLVGGVALSTDAGYACAVISDHTVQCWGREFVGELGDGPPGTTTRPSPSAATAIGGLTDAIAVSTSDHFACALRASGSVVCWGRNTEGEIGDGSSPQNEVLGPTTVLGLNDAIAIGAGANHACAVRADGTIECWGFNARGQLGDGTLTNLLSPNSGSRVSGLIRTTAVGAGTNFSCALNRDGKVFCWGSDVEATLGDGRGQGLPDKSTPVPVQF